MPLPKEGCCIEEKDFALLRTLKETRSITRAAESLYMTQSALSKRILAMEKELGVELLLRSRQGVRFTPEGERVLAHCETVSNALRRMRQGLDTLKGSVGGSLTVGVCFSYASCRLPGALEAYRALYPGVSVDVVTGYSRPLYRRLVDGALDLVVLRGEYPWAGEQLWLRREDYCLIYHRKYQGMPLTDYPYIERTEAVGDTVMPRSKRRWIVEQGLNPDEVDFSVDSIDVCLEMVQQGMGWSVVPDVGLQDFDGCVEVCRFRDGKTFGRSTYALCHREAMELPQVRAFAQLLRAHG